MPRRHVKLQFSNLKPSYKPGYVIDRIENTKLISTSPIKMIDIREMIEIK